MTITRSYRFVAVPIIFIFLSACGPAKPASTPVPTSSAASVTAHPSSTASFTPPATRKVPSETSTPKQTPILPLPSRGPYFAFLTQKDDGSILTLIGEDGTGRKEIALPASNRTGNCLACVISPDGQWLAYWTGSAGNSQTFDPSGPFDLQLNLLHIPDGATVKVAGLLSPDYPDNFQKSAEAAKNLPEFSGQDVSSIANGLRTTFLWGIESATWSPDSRFLAFAGEMDGPSSDLYVYDMAQKSILRLSSGSTNIISASGPAILWSPDGKWIVYTSAYLAGEGMTVTFHAAHPDGGQFWDFMAEVDGLSEWVSPSVFLTNRGENGIGSYGLRRNNLETGGSSVIWQCPFGSYRYDPEEGFFIVENISGPPAWNCQYPGLYFGFPSSAPARLLFRAEEFNSFPWIGFLGQGDRRFLIYRDAGTFVISSQGEKDLILEEALAPSISPDRQWVVFTGAGSPICGWMTSTGGPIPRASFFHPERNFTMYPFRTGRCHGWEESSIPRIPPISVGSLILRDTFSLPVPAFISFPGRDGR